MNSLHGVIMCNNTQIPKMQNSGINIPEHIGKGITKHAHFIFFHPDYTVGFGISPNLLARISVLARGLYHR